MRKLFAKGIIVIILLLVVFFYISKTASAQQAGGESSSQSSGTESSGEVTGPLDLDYTGSEAQAFDYDSYIATESNLQVGEVGKPQGIGLLHKTAKDRTSLLIGSAEEKKVAIEVPEYYTIKEGDTLYYISQYFFGNPDLWPVVWSFNPEITNPNWIYPGQVILLAPRKEGEAVKAPEEVGKPIPVEMLMGFIPWKSGTVYTRPYGLIDKEIEEKTGQIIGSFQDTLFLDNNHKVYIKYKTGKAPEPGSHLTVYEIVSKVRDNEKRNIKYGKLVRILGLVKILKVDKDHKIATGVIEESLRPIQRNDLVGPIKFKFDKIEPVKAGLDLEGKIIAPLEDLEYSGQFDTIFINLGKKDGVVEGNIIKIVRKRDAYMESIDKKDKSPHFPWEVIGKAMVVEALKNTSTCIVIDSKLEIKRGDKIWLKKGE